MKDGRLGTEILMHRIERFGERECPEGLESHGVALLAVRRRDTSVARPFEIAGSSGGGFDVDLNLRPGVAFATTAGTDRIFQPARRPNEPDLGEPDSTALGSSRILESAARHAAPTGAPDRDGVGLDAWDGSCTRPADCTSKPSASSL
jgi:hypothetical protein